MRDRPISTGAACWLLIIVSTVVLLSSFTVLNSDGMQKRMKANPLPVHVQVAQYFVAAVVPLIAGIFMYEGANWARILYLVWGVVNYGIVAFFVPDKSELLPGLPVFAMIAILILLPGPHRYFTLPRHYS